MKLALVLSTSAVSLSLLINAFVVLPERRRLIRKESLLLRSKIRNQDERTELSKTISALENDDNSQQQQLSSRRDLLINAASATMAASSISVSPEFSEAITIPLSADGRESLPTTDNDFLIADLPMIRLKLPKGMLGREYVAIKIKIQGKGPFDFMVDTGLTTEMITPNLQQTLGLKIDTRSHRSRVKGLGAGGGTNANELIELYGVTLCCGSIDSRYADNNNELQLPVLNAVVTDFIQEHIDPQHDPVEGMIGMELLSQFDVDFDFPAGRLRLYKPGKIASTATVRNGKMVEIPAVTINESGLIGIRITNPQAGGGPPKPIIGILDCGATFSCVNWAATQYLGLPTNKEDPAYQKGARIAAMGIDAEPLLLPTISTQLSYAGDIRRDSTTGQPIGFETPPKPWKSWDSVQIGVGDLPAFAILLSTDGINPYTGPAALIGLDILSQRRIIFEAPKEASRKRRVFVS